MALSQDQLAQLQNKVAVLVNDKQDADNKANQVAQTDSVLVQATQSSNQAKVDKANADAKLGADVDDLRAFVDALASNPT